MAVLFNNVYYRAYVIIGLLDYWAGVMRKLLLFKSMFQLTCPHNIVYVINFYLIIFPA